MMTSQTFRMFSILIFSALLVGGIVVGLTSGRFAPPALQASTAIVGGTAPTAIPTIGSTAPTATPTIGTTAPTAIHIVAGFSTRPRLPAGETVLVGKSPFEVRFVNETTSFFPDPRYEWDWGNSGNISTEVNPTHKFRLRDGETTHTFKVVLKATDTNGNSSISSLRVKITK